MKLRIDRFGNLLNEGIQKIVDYGVEEIACSSIDVSSIFQREARKSAEEAFYEGSTSTQSDDVNELELGMSLHVQMARNLFGVKLERDMVMEDVSYEDEYSSFS